MHARAVTCLMCQQRYFPASLRFHVKTCSQKPEHIDLPCDYCDARFPFAVLQSHMQNCRRGHTGARTTRETARLLQKRATRQRGATRNIDVPTGADSARQQQHPLSTPPDGKVNTALPVSGPPDLGGYRENEGEGNLVVTSSDGRLACSNCHRWFSSDRVGVHQEICLRVNTDETRGRNKTKRAASVAPPRRRSSCPVARCHAARARRTWGPLLGRGRGGACCTVDAVDRLGATKGDPKTSTRQSSGASMAKSITKPAAPSLRLTGEQSRESCDETWLQIEKRRTKGGHAPAAGTNVARRPRPASAVGWVSPATRAVEGSGRCHIERVVSSSWSPVRMRSSSRVLPVRGASFARSDFGNSDGRRGVSGGGGHGVARQGLTAAPSTRDGMG